MEKEAEAQRKIQDKEARLDRLKEIMASRGQQPRTPMVSRGRHAAAATPSTTRAERAVWFFIFFLIVSFCRKRRFMRLRPNRQNRLNQTISRFFQALLTYNTLDRFLILCNENKIYLKSCANIICLITKKREKFFFPWANFIFSEICANGQYRLRGSWMISPMILQWPRNLVRSKTRRRQISETKTGHLQNLKDLPNVPEDPSNR